MTLMNILGLLSLISLIILLIIYILKPNYQQQFISSTYIWKLSLKYRKRKLPTSKLRNILLILCQVLLLVTLTAILTRPVNITKAETNDEVIYIVDASASMRAKKDDKTRFDRAMDLVKEKVRASFDEGYVVDVVISSNKPYFLVERGHVESRYEIDRTIDDFKADNFSCSYGESNIDDAISLCADIIEENPGTHTYIFTDLDVAFVDDRIDVINVCEEGEFNFAILDAYSEIVENYYSFTVEVAGYGRDENIELSLTVNNANVSDLDPTGINKTFNINVDLIGDEPKRVIFISSSIDTSALSEDENTILYLFNDDEKIYTYESAHLGIDIEDCFMDDNTFEIYGGTKENIKVLYASSMSNNFFNGVLFVLRNTLKDKYHLDLTEIKEGVAPYSGYDLYIYEHQMMPDVAPSDGIAIYVNPEKNVSNSGFSIAGYRDLGGGSISLMQEMDHPLLKNVEISDITVSRYTELLSFDSSYEPLAQANGKPVILCKNEEDSKSIIISFSLHYSNFAVLKDFPLFMNNVFDYFIPTIIDGNSFEVNDTVEIRSRSPEIRVSGNDNEQIIESFPTTISLDVPGVYTIEQTTYFGKYLTDQIYAKIPKNESNIFGVKDTIVNPVSSTNEHDQINDLVLYIAFALSFLLLAERLLSGKDVA